MKKFSDQIRNARREAGFTQDELGKKIHVARNTISSWEHGRTRPDLEMMRKLSEALKIDFLHEDENQDFLNMLSGKKEAVLKADVSIQPEENRDTGKKLKTISFQIVANVKVTLEE